MVAETKNIQVTSVGSEGQVTIPLEVRDALGLRDGEAVVFERKDDYIVMRRATVVERTAGALSAYSKVPPSTVEEMKEAFAQSIAEENAEYE